MTYLSSFIFGISAFGQNTVSVPFNNGFVGEIAANGTTSRTSSYSFTPSLPYIHSTSYFRLKQCDYDGDCELFPTVSVNCESNEKHI